MKLLSRSEEIILVAIWRLGENAYGVTIREYVSKVTGYEWDFAAVYIALNKLTKNRYVEKTIAAPTKERGGRRKSLYTISPDGKKALNEIREIQRELWNGIPDVAFNERS